VIIELSSYLDSGGAHGTGPRLHQLLAPAAQGADAVGHAAAGPGRRVLEGRAGGAQQLADQHQADQEPEFVKTWPFQKTPNVALTYGGVMLKYETSTIAPYALGHVELKIPTRA
jgi:hypothetical protein